MFDLEHLVIVDTCSMAGIAEVVVFADHALPSNAYDVLAILDKRWN